MNYREYMTVMPTYSWNRNNGFTELNILQTGIVYFIIWGQWIQWSYHRWFGCIVEKDRVRWNIDKEIG